MSVDRGDWPIHRPEADAPIPGRHWFAGCEPGGDFDPEVGNYVGAGPRVDPATGICEGCGERACPMCGRENCPDCPRASVDRALRAMSPEAASLAVGCEFIDAQTGRTIHPLDVKIPDA